MLCLLLLVDNHLCDFASLSSSSSAHPVLVFQEHVILEQHLLQPGCAHEPAGGLLLPSGGCAWRLVFLFLFALHHLENYSSYLKGPAAKNDSAPRAE